jgi:hypothetical protein
MLPILQHVFLNYAHFSGILILSVLLFFYCFGAFATKVASPGLSIRKQQLENG